MIKPLLFSTLFALSSLAQSANLYTDEVGHVDRADFEAKEIVIDDMFYRITEDFKLHSSRPGMDANKLRKGDKVRFNYIRDDSRNQFLLEAWLLKK